jgi:protein-S-isoprenylcysteine O-methyltransferase Ste14
VSWIRIDTCVWAVFALVWLVAAPFSRRNVRHEGMARLVYGIPLACGVGLLFTTRAARFVPVLGARLLPEGDALGVAGVALSAAGVAVAFWARAHLGRMWSGAITLKEGHRLVDTGPYRLARHPIYTGILLGLIGTFVIVGTVGGLLGLAIIVGGLVVKLGREERLMAESFGDEHAAYRARVKRLVPFVW